jgi:hypothetical protein
MNNNVVNTMPYLRTSREYPKDDPKQLSIELHKTYIDVALAVNNRTIGIYPANRPAVGGESWFITNQKQQNFRQIYPFSSTGNIPHNLNWSSISFISPKSYGTYTDDTNWYGAIYASNTPIAGQVSFYVTDQYVVVIAGSSPSPPTIDSGYIVLEWISNV